MPVGGAMGEGGYIPNCLMSIAGGGGDAVSPNLWLCRTDSGWCMG